MKKNKKKLLTAVVATTALVFGTVAPALAMPDVIKVTRPDNTVVQYTMADAMLKPTLMAQMVKDITAAFPMREPMVGILTNGTVVDLEAGLTSGTTSYNTYEAGVLAGTTAHGTDITATSNVGVDASGNLTYTPVSSASTVVSVSAVNGTINVGGTTGFVFNTTNGTTPTGVVYSVTSANASTGFFSNGMFTATAAGTYTIQATVGATNVSTTVNVSGIASAIQLSGATQSIIANGKATNKVTATVLDTNGTTVSGFNGTASISIPTTGGGALVDGNGGTITKVTFVNGVGTFYVLAPTALPTPAYDTVSTSNLVSTNSNGITSTVNYGTLTTNYIAQAASGLTVIPSSSTFSCNDGTIADSLTVNVNDGSGNPVTANIFQSVTLTITGPGSFTAVNTSSPATTTRNLVLTQGSNAAIVSVYPIQGQSGTITITATSSGLTNGSTTITTLSTGVPTNTTITSTRGIANSTSVLTPGTTFTLYTLTLQDANGNPVVVPNGSSDVLTLSDSSLALSTPGVMQYYNVDSSGQPTGSAWTANAGTGAYTASVPSNGLLQFAVSNTTVGSSAATITILDQFTGVTKTSTYTFVKGSENTVKLLSGVAATSNVTAGSTNTISVQLVDSNGNNIAVAGDNVSFYFDGTTLNDANATMGGSSTWSPTSPYIVATDSTGKATVTLNVPSTTASGKHYKVDAIYGSMGAPVTVTQTVQSAANVGTGIVFSSVTTAANGIPTAVTWPSNATIASGKYLSGYTSNVLTPSSSSAQPALYANLTNAVATDTIGGSAADTIQLTVSDTNMLAITPGGSWTKTSANGITTNVTYTANETTTGVQLPIIQAANGGNATITVSDLSNPSVPSQVLNFTVVGGSVSGNAAVMYNGKASSTTNTLSISAGVPVPINIVNVDAAGNAVPVDSTGNQIVILADTANGGTFRLTPTGSNVSFVSIPIGSTSATVYYVNGVSGNYSLLAGTTADAGQAIAITPPGAATAGTAATYTLALTGHAGASGNAGTLPISIIGAVNSPSGTAPTLATSTITFVGGAATDTVTFTAATPQTLTFNIAGITKSVASITPAAAQSITAGTASATVPDFTTGATTWKYSSNAVATVGTSVGATDISANIHVTKNTAAAVSSIVFSSGAKTLVITMGATGSSGDTVTIKANQFEDTYGNVLSGIITLTSDGSTWTPSMN